MKKLIKKILREQAESELQTPDQPGGWKNPLIDDSPGNVPPESYVAQSYNQDTKKYYKPTITKNIFFKAVQILSKMNSAQWFTTMEDPNDNLWSRQQDMSTPLKVLGIGTDNGGLSDKIFWAANDNRKGILDGSITNYDQLYLRPLIEYKVPLYEAAREYKTIYWTPEVPSYSKEDAFNTVMYDEDGYYDSYEWDGHSSYDVDSEEWDSEGKELDGDIKIKGTMYPAEEGSTPLKESIIEEMGPSPEENDIISDLTELVQSWDGCEEGMPVACRYKNQVQEIIDRYTSMGLYEHRDNFTSHYDEPKIGDSVVNTNPGCVHYKSEGVIEDINDLPDEMGTTISYRVTNNGDNYIEGDILTKTPDQLEPIS